MPPLTKCKNAFSVDTGIRTYAVGIVWGGYIAGVLWWPTHKLDIMTPAPQRYDVHNTDSGTMVKRTGCCRRVALH